MHLSIRRSIGIVASAAISFAFPAFAQEAKPDARPNVLFVAVDDLKPELGCYGSPIAKSPNIDRLAARGTVFLKAYCQQAVCAPSRASLLSGCRPDTTRIYNLETPLRSVMPDVVTLPQRFKQSGYTTLSMGKIYHHRNDDAQGWSEKPTGYPGMTWLAEESKRVVEQRKIDEPDTKARSYGRGPAYESPDVPDDAYADGKLALDAVARIEGFAKSREPFFLALGFARPHLPFNAPKKYWDLYDPNSIKLADNAHPPVDAPEIALHTSGEIRAYAGVPKEGPVATDEVARTLIHGYLASVSYMDAQLGKVLDALDKTGLSENTIIILWGDHGWHLGDHGLWCKHTNFESATRAPLIIHAPGFAPGKTPRVAEFVDVFPTLCELAKLDPPPTLEGTSLVPLMRDANLAPEKWKKAAFSQYPRAGGVMGYSVTDGRYRFTSWQKKDGSVVAAELYDHENDPQENKNLAGKTDHAEAQKRMSDLLAGGWKAAMN